MSTPSIIQGHYPITVPCHNPILDVSSPARTNYNHQGGFFLLNVAATCALIGAIAGVSVGQLLG